MLPSIKRRAFVFCSRVSPFLRTNTFYIGVRHVLSKSCTKQKRAGWPFIPPCHERCRETVATNVVIWLSETDFRGRKPLQNTDFWRSGSYSHSMRSNAFSLIFVSPVRSRDSDSTDYLYSPCSTASVYHFFISVIKRLFCCGLRGLFPWNHCTIPLPYMQSFLVSAG